MKGGGKRMNMSEFAKLTDDYGNDVYGFCAGLAHDAEELAELYQDTFLKAAEMAQRIDKDKNPKAFLMSIAVSVWKNGRKKHAVRSRIAPRADEEELRSVHSSFDLQEEIIEKERREVIRKAVAALGEKHRVVVLMYYNAGMSVREIAEAEKISEGTVKSRLFSARAEIKQRLEEYEYDGNQTGQRDKVGTEIQR